MSTLSMLVASVLVAVPDRPMEAPTAASWVGKTVYARASGLAIDTSAEPNDGVKGGLPVNMISYRVYAERPGHVQVKTRDGVSGWLRKADVVPAEDAVPFFTKLLEANPNDASLFSRRAAAWRTKGELDAAIKDATEAIRLSPNAAYYNNRALIWHAKKDYDKAIADYAQALTINPRYALVFANRATMWHAKKEYDKAIEDTTQSIQIEPKNPTAYRVRGISRHGKREYDKAIDDLNKSLEIDPRSSQALADRANTWAAKKEHAKALDDYNASVKLEMSNVPAVAAAALWLASCPEAKYRDGKRALELAKHAQKLERTNSQVLQALAAAHAEVGQFADAVRWQEHALGDPQLQNNNEASARLELYRKMQPYRRE